MTYMIKFGFVPCVRHAADEEAWDYINQHLRVPFRANEVIEVGSKRLQ